MTEENTENVEETSGEETPQETISTEETQVGNFEEPDYSEIAGIAEEPAPAEEIHDTETPPETPESQETEPTPVAAKESESPPAEKEETTIEATESPPEVTPPAAEETPGQTPLSDEDYQAAMTKHMTDATEKLQTLYSFSEEEAANIDDLDSKPSEWLPKLMAQLHYNVFMSQRADIQNTLPDAVSGITRQNLAYANAESKFFEAYPALTEHKEVATRAAAQIRQTNPNLQGDALMKAVGDLTMASVGLTPAPVNAPAPVVPIVPPAPAGVGQSGAPAQGAPAGSYEEGVYASMVEEEIGGA